jgi:hypothetical protein
MSRLFVDAVTFDLQNVKRDQSGVYTCVAHNIEGDGVSNPVNLNIKCKQTHESSGPGSVFGNL